MSARGPLRLVVGRHLSHTRHVWQLTLDCGHVVERRPRYRLNERRERKIVEPAQAFCELCAKGTK